MVEVSDTTTSSLGSHFPKEVLCAIAGVWELFCRLFYCSLISLDLVNWKSLSDWHEQVEPGSSGEQPWANGLASSRTVARVQPGFLLGCNNVSGWNNCHSCLSGWADDVLLYSKQEGKQQENPACISLNTRLNDSRARWCSVRPCYIRMGVCSQLKRQMSAHWSSKKRT